MVKVSVVIPTYNRVNTLPRALRSVLAQTYRCHEIIVVDDGSTDDTAQMLRQYFPGVIYRCLSAKANASVARNQGIDLATGDWVAFLDSDDAWDESHVEEAMLRLEESPEASLVAMSFCVFDNRGRTSQRWLSDARAGSVVEQLVLGTLDLRSSTLVADRERASRVRFDDGLAKHQDWDFTARWERVGVVVTSAVSTVHISVGDASRMSSRPNHTASARFLRRYASALSCSAKASFACQQAEATLRAEGRNRRFYRYIICSLPLMLSGYWSKLAKLLLLLLPGGKQLLDRVREGRLK